jgi:hypothetical protein
MQGFLWVGRPDAHIGRRGDDKGVLVADVGRVLGRRDEEVVLTWIATDAHVGHVAVTGVRLAIVLNPQTEHAGIGGLDRGTHQIAENF